MFEYSFVPSGKTRRPLTVAMACAGEAMLIGGLILAPLLFVESLPQRGLMNALMLAPVPMAPPAPPAPILAKKIPQAARAPRRFNPTALMSPVAVPKVVAILNEAPPLEMDTVPGGIPGGIPGVGMPGGTGFLSSALSMAPPPPPPARIAPPPPAAPLEAIIVGGDVQEGLLLQQVVPVYPAGARAGRIQGVVTLKALIGPDGKIRHLTVVNGHPLLVEAAMLAVRHWTYRPTLLNGIPVEVKTDILVHFRLTNS